MRNLNFLFVVLFIAALSFACEEKPESYSGSPLQDSIATARVYQAPPNREAADTSANLALLANAYAQSTFSGYSPGRINDGSNNTTVGGSHSWANAYKYAPDGYLPQWVDLRFDTAITFSQLKLYTSYHYEMRDWTMLALDSTSAQWDTLGIVNNNTSTMRSFTFSPSVTADVVRILCQDGPSSQSGYARINEVELY